MKWPFKLSEVTLEAYAKGFRRGEDIGVGMGAKLQKEAYDNGRLDGMAVVRAEFDAANNDAALDKLAARITDSMLQDAAAEGAINAIRELGEAGMYGAVKHDYYSSVNFQNDDEIRAWLDEHPNVIKSIVVPANLKRPIVPATTRDENNNVVPVTK